MTNVVPTFGAEPESFVRLLSLGLGGDKRDSGAAEQAKADLLRARLAGPLPPGGRPLGEALLDEATAPAVLERIKDYGKSLVRRKQSDAEHSVGTAIYYAAIASALVFQGTKITRHSYPALADAFDKLSEKPWMAPELLRQFSRAREICRGRADSSRSAAVNT